MTDDGGDDFESFVGRYERSLVATATLLLGDHAAAEDVVQTTFVRMYSKWDRLKDDRPLAYARRAVLNGGRDWFRRRRRESVVADVPERGDPVDRTSGATDRDGLVRALQRLTLKERQALICRYLLDLSEQDTAEQLGWALGSVKSTTHRAIHKLRADHELATLETETS